MDKISARELRIGNYIKFTTGEVVKVSAIAYDEVAIDQDNELLPMSEYDPIPLTPELLERCGFDGNPNTMKGASLEIKDHERVFKSISIYYNNDTAENQYYLFMREGAKDEPRTNDGVVLLMRNLQYLHQLQNLYYALTGIELDVKM